MNGIEHEAVPKPSWLARWFGWRRNEVALGTIRNLIATTPLESVTHGAIAEILSSARVDPGALQEGFLKLYGDVLAHFAGDDELNEREVRDLRRLRDLLGLRELDVASVRRRFLQSRLRPHVDAALEDDRLDERERDAIERLGARLQLSDAEVREVCSDAIDDLARRVIREVVADRRITPAEDERLKVIREQLGADFRGEEASPARLDYYRLMWRVEQGELPTESVAIHLQRGEVSHVHLAGSRSEMRTVTKRIRYSGPTYRLRIAKGLYWRIGDIGVQRVTNDELRLLDTGTLYVTSKRLLFDGDHQSSNVPYRRIIDVTPLEDGIRVEKDSGKDQVYRFDERYVELVTAVVLQAVARWNEGR